jgi:hypothetical protein
MNGGSTIEQGKDGFGEEYWNAKKIIKLHLSLPRMLPV